MHRGRERRRYAQDTSRSNSICSHLFGWLSCIPPPKEAATPSPIVSPVLAVGPAEICDLQPTTEIVTNCGGGNNTITKHPAMTVLTSHAVEWETGGQAGVSVNIGDGPVPGGVDLAAALDTHIKGVGDIGTALRPCVPYSLDTPKETKTTEYSSYYTII